MAKQEDAIARLTEIIAGGLQAVPEGGVKPALQDLFGERYQQKHLEPTLLRDAYALAGEDKKGGVPYAGLINPDNPPSGPYGGTSLVWFPTEEAGSLIGLGVGTRGLSPDEGILMRPGHRRRVQALRRVLALQGVEAWTKSDPAAIDTDMPKSTKSRFRGFEKVFARYGKLMYCNAVVPAELDAARVVVEAFFDLYAYERDWSVLKAHQAEFDAVIDQVQGGLFECPTPESVKALLESRRFVVLQGPPGTGKTRLANLVKEEEFGGNGMTVQFHPAVTYEDFVIGLSPDTQEGSLRFGVREGWLLEAVKGAANGPFLLVVDEVNRADLGKVLGEAIYLFEAGEVGGENARAVELPHRWSEGKSLTIPENLFVLATMNTADRSVAAMDLAVRRRFAFVDVPPDREVIAAQEHLQSAVGVFDRIVNVFVNYAPDEALNLIPGHSYFLASGEEQLRERFHYELLPLLNEYLKQGLLGSAASDLHAVRDEIEDIVHGRPA